MNFIKKTKNNMVYYYCPELLEKGFKHLFSTRIGGVSFNKNELNFGTSCGDSEENILKNYSRVFEILGTTPENTVKSKQTHSDIIITVDKSFGGEGIIKEQRFFEADGLITNERDLTILVFYADCVPVIIADPVTKSACAVHSGWRGTKENISIKAISKMVNNGSDPKDLMAVIGPAIGLCHFEVSENVYMEFKNSPYNEFLVKKDGKFYIDLKKTVKKQIINSGVLEENIAISDICTFCDNEMYSYRREGEKAGRMAAFIKTPK